MTITVTNIIYDIILISIIVALYLTLYASVTAMRRHKSKKPPTKGNPFRRFNDFQLRSIVKRQWLWLVLAIGMSGCAVVDKPAVKTSAPPMPPMPTAARMAMSSAPAQPATVLSVVPPAPQPVTTNHIYIGHNADGPYLWWVANELKNYVLTSTNMVANVQLWEPLSVDGATVTDGIASIPVTNRVSSPRFYRLLSVPTNHVVFSWRYIFTNQVSGFKLYQGLESQAYSTNYDIPGKWLWQSHEVTGTNRAYYVVTAYDQTGVESEVSNEVSYQPWEVLGVTNRP